MEDALYEVESMRRFAALDLTDDAMPVETTNLKFRRLLEEHALTGQMMNIVKRALEMHQTKTGNPRNFGMKVRPGANINSGLVHTVSVTPGKVSDINQLQHPVP